MEEAVHDGVDVINLSIGSSLKKAFDQDPIAIGAFNAVAKGILVVASAGNYGPTPYTLSNDAPWMLSVGAGSVDRHFEAKVEYDHIVFDGETLVQNTGLEGDYGVVDGNYCDNDRQLGDIAHKMIVCKSVTDGSQRSIIRRVRDLGAGGVILIDDVRHGYTTMLTKFDGFNVIMVSVLHFGFFFCH
jgi:hypothetical protein